MDQVFIPILDSADYEAFKGVLAGHIPGTYKGWLSLYSNWCDYYKREGDVIVSAPVNPQKFIQYLSRSKDAANLKSLLTFSELVARGNLT